MDIYSTSTSALGLVVLAVVIVGPLSTLLIATMFGGPRVGNPKPLGGKVKLVFLGTMVTVVLAAIVLTSVLGGVMSLIVPQ